MAVFGTVITTQVITPESWAKRVEPNAQDVTWIWLQNKQTNKQTNSYWSIIWKYNIPSYTTHQQNHLTQDLYFYLIKTFHSTYKDEQIAVLGSFWKGAVFWTAFPNAGRATGESAHQHRRSERGAQTWLDTTAQSQRPSDTCTMDLSDRLPIWPPPRNPSTFLAQQWCSAAKGAWVRVECLPLNPTHPYQRRSTERHFHKDRKSGQTAQGHIYH